MPDQKEREHRLRQRAASFKNIAALIGSYNVKPVDAAISDNVHKELIAPFPAMKKKGAPATVLVIELEGSDHIKMTTSTAKTMRAGLAGDANAANKVIGMPRALISGTPYMGKPEWEVVTALLRHPDMMAGHAIISSSEGISENHKDISVNRNEAEDWQAAESLNPVVYKAIGNERTGDGLGNRQGYELFAHTPRSVYVGSATWVDGTYVMAGHSENAPGITAALISKDEEIGGTSFAAPLAAALHAELQERYGQSDQQPRGLTAEEIQFVLMASVNKKVMDEYNRERLPFTFRESPLSFNEHAGFGIMDKDAADKLAGEMLAFKQKEQQVTKPLLVAADVKVADKSIFPELPEGLHAYTVTVPQTMTLNNLRFDLHTQQDKENQAAIIFRGHKIPLYVSNSGAVSERRLLATDIQQGETITLITAEPLDEARTNVSIRGFNSDSAISAFRDAKKDAWYREAMTDIDARTKDFISEYNAAAKAFARQDHYHLPILTPDKQLDELKGQIEQAIKAGDVKKEINLRHAYLTEMKKHVTPDMIARRELSHKFANEALLDVIGMPRSGEIIRLLKEAGADPNMPSKSGIRPLFEAVTLQDQEAIEALFAIGAKPNLFPIGQSKMLVETPLDRAQAVLQEYESAKYPENYIERAKEIIELLKAHGGKTAQEVLHPARQQAKPVQSQIPQPINQSFSLPGMPKLEMKLPVINLASLPDIFYPYLTTPNDPATTVQRQTQNTIR